MKAVQILAHRGLVSEFVPENSLKAFADALAVGADVIETDVQCTRDGVPIVFHDEDLARMCGVAKKVTELDWTEIENLDIGFGKRIPTLKEALLAFPGARFNLDIKSEKSIAPTAELINQLGVHSRILISSFSDSRRLRTIALLKTKVKTSAGVSLVLRLLISSTLGLGFWARALAKNISALQIPTRQGLLRLDSPGFIKKMKSLNLEVHYWTINNASEMHRLVKLGASGIVTDHCDLAIQELKK